LPGVPPPGVPPPLLPLELPLPTNTKLAVTVVALFGIVNVVLLLLELAKLPPFEEVHPLNAYPLIATALIGMLDPCAY
jgi:hypothetical protein